MSIDQISLSRPDALGLMGWDPNYLDSPFSCNYELVWLQTCRSFLAESLHQ